MENKKSVTAVEWLVEELEDNGINLDLASEIVEQAKEIEKEKQGYSEEVVENLIRTTYEETMRAMIDWFVNNKDKNQEEMESAIDNYVYPRLAKKGINFKKE